jgi:hypothetical protein
MTPELERKIWYAYRAAHEAIAAAADGDVNSPFATHIRKQMPGASLAEIKATLKRLAHDARNNPEFRAALFASVVSEQVPEASADDTRAAMDSLARAMERDDPDVLALMGHIRLS